MSSKRASKRFSTTHDFSSSPLSDTSILSEIYSFVGPGHWLFLALVSKDWHELYKKVQNRETTTVDTYGNKHRTLVTSRMTLGSAVFASPSRVNYAHDCGLHLSKKELQQTAGIYASCRALKAARKHGMPLTDTLTNHVALSGDLARLKYVSKLSEHPLPDSASWYAAGSGNIKMTRWLGSDDVVQQAVYAIKYGHLKMLRYLYHAYEDEEEMDWMDCTICNKLTVEAVRHNRLQIVDWLIKHSLATKSEVALIAVHWNNVQVLQQVIRDAANWDSKNDAEYQLQELLNAAGAFGSLDARKWLRNNGAVWPSTLCMTTFTTAMNRSGITLLLFGQEQKDVHHLGQKVSMIAIDESNGNIR
jgi:hypothetical protein